MVKNHGLLPEPPRKETDNVLGVGDTAPVITNDPLFFWRQEKFNPQNSYQVDRNGEDLMACVAFSIDDGYERYFNYLISVNPEVENTLDMLGCMDNGKVHFSDSFTAVMSDTDPDYGNSVTNVCDAVHKFGLLGYKYKSWDNTMLKSEFYSQPTDEMKAQALLMLKFFDLRHAWLTTGQISGMEGATPSDAILRALTKGTVRVSVDGGAYSEKDENGYINGCHQYSHSVLHIGGLKDVYAQIHDHYNQQYPRFTYQYPCGSGKLLYVLVKKKLSLVKKIGSPAVYLYSSVLDKYFGISDGDAKFQDGSPVITGGELLKIFSGDYKNASIETIADIPLEKIGKPIKQID